MPLKKFTLTFLADKLSEVHLLSTYTIFGLYKKNRTRKPLYKLIPTKMYVLYPPSPQLCTSSPFSPHPRAPMSLFLCTVIPHPPPPPTKCATIHLSSVRSMSVVKACTSFTLNFLTPPPSCASSGHAPLQNA
jgi:hypothetical protein